MCAFSPMKRDLQSILAVWICMITVSWWYFFCHALIPHHLFFKGIELVKKTFQWKASLKYLKYTLLFHILFSYFFFPTERTSARLFPPNIFMILERTQSTNPISQGTASRVKSFLTWCRSWIVMLFTLCMIPVQLRNVDLSWSQQTIKQKVKHMLGRRHDKMNLKWCPHPPKKAQCFKGLCEENSNKQKRQCFTRVLHTDQKQ